MCRRWLVHSALQFWPENLGANYLQSFVSDLTAELAKRCLSIAAHQMVVSSRWCTDNAMVSTPPEKNSCRMVTCSAADRPSPSARSSPSIGTCVVPHVWSETVTRAKQKKHMNYVYSDSPTLYSGHPTTRSLSTSDHVRSSSSVEIMRLLRSPYFDAQWHAGRSESTEGGMDLGRNRPYESREE